MTLNQIDGEHFSAIAASSNKCLQPTLGTPSTYLMKASRAHQNRRFPRRRKEAEYSAQAEAHWLDVWLPRISHFSQFGLFAITIGSLYFVVLPLYQKAVLEEAVARKEIELKESEKTLDESYSRVRAFAVKEFVFSTKVKCSMLMLPPRGLRSPESKSYDERPFAEEILAINSSECLMRQFRKHPSLKQLGVNTEAFLNEQKPILRF